MLRWIRSTIGIACALVVGLGALPPIPPAAAADGGAPDPAAILAASKKAAGGDAWDAVTTIHARLKVATSGLEGTADGWEDLHTGRYMSTFELGPVTGAEGFDGSLSWTRDASGQPLAGEGEDDRRGAANNGYRTALAWWYPERWPAEVAFDRRESEGDRAFQVLRIVPRGGRAFELWVDADSHRIDRTVEPTAIETRSTYYSDFRETNGVFYPHVSRQSNGETRYDTHFEVESVEFNVPLEEERFAMPAPPPPDFRFAGGAATTRLPFRLLNNHMYLEIRLNGRGPYLFLCDTGGANVITPTLARELGLEPVGTLQGRGAGEESEDVGIVRVDSLTVGDVTLSDPVFAVFPMEGFSDVEGVPMLGLIGYEVFKRFVVRIDYDEGQITLTRPDAFHYEGDGTEVPFRFNGRIPQVDGSIDGVSGTFDIDTGARSSLTLMGPFVEAHSLGGHFPAGVEGVTGWGVGGPVRTHVTRARSLRLGGVEIPGPVTELSLQKAGAFTNVYVAGNVGAGVLKRFDITFDYGRGVMIFEPNGFAEEPDVFDRSGMWINQTDEGFQVIDVIAGGPAASVGLSPGDRIVEVEGQPADRVSLPDLRGRFRTEAPGTPIRLRIREDAGDREITLVLEDLV